MIKKVYLLVIIIIFSIFILYSESEQVDRMEFEKEMGDKNNIIPVGNSGFIMFSVNNLTGKTILSNYVTISSYDTNMQMKWENKYDIPKKMEFEKYCKTDNILYILFRQKSSGLSLILQLNLSTGEEKKFEGKIVPNGSFLELTANQNIIYYIVSLKDQLVIDIIDFDTGIQTLNILGTKGKTIYKNISIHKNEDSVSVVYYDKKIKSFFCKLFDKFGREMYILNFPQNDKDHIFLTGSFYYINENEQILMGSYNNNMTDYAQGIYIAIIKNNELSNVKYHTYSSFNNFFSFLPDWEKNFVDKNIKKKNDKGQDYKVSLNFLEHDIILNDKGFMWIAESYYATYRTQVMTSYMNGQAVTSYMQVFNGWRYSHAIAAEFDINGEKLWDSCFKIGDIITFNLREFIKVNLETEKTTMLYVNGKKICSIELRNGEISQEKEYINLETLEVSKKILANSINNAEYWYDNFFICWGEQLISDKEKDIGKRTKTVFFINKIKFK